LSEVQTPRPWQAANHEVEAVIYVLPANPSNPPVSFSALRQRAKRLGYRIASDRYSETYTLIDARTGLPLAPLDHVALHTIADVIETVREYAKILRKIG
jgi:hypothetical protein